MEGYDVEMKTGTSGDCGLPKPYSIGLGSPFASLPDSTSQSSDPLSFSPHFSVPPHHTPC